MRPTNKLYGFFLLLIAGMLLFPDKGRIGCNGCRRKEVHYRKPVIYLYPLAKTKVKLKVNYNGKFTATYPEYKEGWELTAYPDGHLVDTVTNKEYSYLFWEGIPEVQPQRKIYNEGFIVKGDSVQYFLQEKLAEMGMLPKEYNEFIVFWYPLMKNNAYNFIHFNVGTDYDEISTMEIDPQPDGMLRVFMYYKAMDEPVEVAPQLFDPFVRTGFTLVEWGGGEIKWPITIQPKEKVN